MGLFGFFSAKPKNRVALDLSKVKVDMHSHLIPGIDDGAQNMEETIAMLAKFEALGFSKIITTPHIKHPSYPNSSAKILDGLKEVREQMKLAGINLELEAAAEYYFDETLFHTLESDSFLTFNKNHVLIEFSFSAEPQGHEKLFYDMRIKGYKPVIAHFERYIYFHGSIEKAQEWREKGMLIQMNINSIFGHYGPGVKKQSEKLIDSGQIDFIATDCHRIDHLNLLEQNLSNKYLRKVIELPLHNINL